MAEISEWDGEETFNHMDNLMKNILPHEHSLIRMAIDTNYKPTQKEVAEALLLDFLGFIPSEYKQDKDTR
jgi:hypothetical protein